MIDQKKELAINGLIEQDSSANSMEEYLEGKGLKGLSVVVFEDYERTFEQNEELGLNDMKVEGYENTDDKKLKTIEEK